MTTNLRFTLYFQNGTSAAPNGPLEPTTFTLNVGRNSIPSLSFTYPRQGRHAGTVLGDAFNGDYQIAVEFFDLNTLTWVEPRDCRFVPIRRSLSYGSGTHVQIECVGWTWLLKKCYVDSTAAQASRQLEITYTGNAGQMIRSMLNYYGLPMTFNDAVTSPIIVPGGGVFTKPWASTLTRKYARTTSIMEVLEELTSEGYVDWWGEGAKLAMANAGEAGVAQQGQITFDLNRDLLTYDLSYDISSLVNYGLTTGPPGVQGVATLSTPGVTLPQGIFFEDRVGDDKYNTLSRAADGAKSLLSFGSDQRTAIFGPSPWRPFLDFRPGSRVMIPGRGWDQSGGFDASGNPVNPVFESGTIDSIAMALSEAGGEIETSLTFNSTAIDQQLLLIRRSNRKKSNVDPARISALEPDPDWTVSNSGSNPSVARAFRRHGSVVDVRIRLTYASAPSSLQFSVASGLPSEVRPQTPGTFPGTSMLLTCFANASGSTVRQTLPAFLGTDGSVVMRGASSNSSNLVVFDLQGCYSIA